MDQASSRVPAWKRLGLTLKKEGQSGKTAPDHSRAARHAPPLEPSAEPRQAPRGAFASTGEHHELSQNGKPSSLGKRKPYDVPAETTDHHSKKSRRGDWEEASNGASAPEPMNVVRKEEGLSETRIQDGPPPTNTQQKGDPNYRQKKGKKEKKIWTKQPARDNHTHQQVDSLSPTNGQDLEDGSTLLPSTETDFTPLPATHHVSQKLKRATLDSPPTVARRKSVTFTPDTKKADGNSAQSLSKAWFAGQGGDTVDPSNFIDPALTEGEKPPSDTGVSTLNLKEDKQARRTEKKQKKPKKLVPEPSGSVEDKEAPGPAEIEVSSANKPELSTESKPRGKKKDHSLYLAYLTQYHEDRAHWKFNKAKQNGVLDNALNVFRIPEEYSEALSEYVKGLKGAGVINRLADRCNQAIKDLDAIDLENGINMDDPKVREAARQEALADRLYREKKRRQLDADIEEVAEHPNPEGYIRRLKRRRAEDLRRALNLTEAILPPPKANSSAPGAPDAQKPKRARKSRTVIDDDSSSSSSEDSSSSESDSESGGDAVSDAESEKSAVTGSGSDSDNESSSGSSVSQSGSSDDDNDHSKASASGSDDESTASGEEH